MGISLLFSFSVGLKSHIENKNPWTLRSEYLYGYLCERRLNICGLWNAIIVVCANADKNLWSVRTQTKPVDCANAVKPVDSANGVKTLVLGISILEVNRVTAIVQTSSYMAQLWQRSVFKMNFTLDSQPMAYFYVWEWRMLFCFFFFYFLSKFSITHCPGQAMTFFFF